jgi:hypothetical protein
MSQCCPFQLIHGGHRVWTPRTKHTLANLHHLIPVRRRQIYHFHNIFDLFVSLSHHIGFLGSLGITTPGFLRHWPFRASAHSDGFQQQTEGNQTTMLSPFTITVFEPSVSSPIYVSVMSSFSSSSWKAPCTSTIVHLSGSGPQTLVPRPSVAANPGLPFIINCGL